MFYQHIDTSYTLCLKTKDISTCLSANCPCWIIGNCEIYESINKMQGGCQLVGLVLNADLLKLTRVDWMILCFSFKDTFLLATFLNFCLYLVRLAFWPGVSFTLPFSTFKAHSERHCNRSLSAPRKIALHTWGWAWDRALRIGACRFTREDILS